MIASFQIEKSDLILLVLIMAAGFAVRWIMINRPMTHDESYSVYIWGSSSLRHTTNDYHLPNNHVFHSILVNLIYHTIGKIPAFVRLPAFISGWLIIPFAYLLGRKMYNRHTGLLTAGLTAFSPFLIEYSTGAWLFHVVSVYYFHFSARNICHQTQEFICLVDDDPDFIPRILYTTNHAVSLWCSLCLAVPVFDFFSIFQQLQKSCKFFEIFGPQRTCCFWFFFIAVFPHLHQLRDRCPV